MKNLFTSILVLFAFSCFAQIPDGYYDTAEGLSEDQLKTALYNIIKGHTEYPYTDAGTDVWDILKVADRDPDNSDNVIGIYSGFSMLAGAAGEEYDNGKGWNREHVWAKSRGDFGTSVGPGTDCHHLAAADISTNSARNNRNFGWGDYYYNDVDANGLYNGLTESKTGNSGNYVWEPRDSKKGDVARMIFYMATRYEGENGEPDLELTENLLTLTDKSPLHAKLSVLLEWSTLDPVSEEEYARNEVIYSYQNNRNPFIDHPEYVNAIYDPSTTDILSISEMDKINIYPNPASDILNIDLPVNYSVEIFSIIGEKRLSSNKKQININDLDAGMYFVLIKNEIGNTVKSRKIIKK